MGEITEPTLKLCLNEQSIRRVAEVLRAAHLDLIAEQVEAQIPAPYPLEPKGDCIVFVFDTAYKRPRDNWQTWYPFEAGPTYDWEGLIAECDRTNSPRPVVYRREV